MRALFAGSFDPVTLGHLDVISRVAGFADTLVIAVAVNRAKRPWFTTAERVALLEAVCHPWSNVTVQTFEGLVAEMARAVGADCLMRGVRGADDFAREQQMAQANRALTGIDTLLLPASPGVSWISSSLVREVVSFGGDVTAFVPPAVAAHISANLERFTSL